MMTKLILKKLLNILPLLLQVTKMLGQFTTLLAFAWL